MRYEQPNVLLLGSAAEVVQGVSSKGSPVQDDNISPLLARTDGSAYQADE